MCGKRVASAATALGAVAYGERGDLQQPHDLSLSLADLAQPLRLCFACSPHSIDLPHALRIFSLCCAAQLSCRASARLHAAEGMLNTRGDGVHICPLRATALAAAAANRIGRARRRFNQPRRAAAGAPRLVGSCLALTLASGMREGRACASTTRRVAQHLAPSPSAAAASDCYEAPRPMRCR